MKQGTCHGDQLKSLNRIEGQVRGIAGMIEEQRYCVDILQQIKAVKSALGSVERKIIDSHLNDLIGVFHLVVVVVDREADVALVVQD